ncbi:MAG: hypothetical protein ABFD45_03620 [Smithella sp.]
MVDEEKLKSMSIDSIEEIIDNCIRDARRVQKEMIEILIYLKTSGRWKENKLYSSRASFDQYVEDRFNIRKNAFLEMQTAFIKFPSETIEYGIGLVCRVRRLCGPIKTAKVFRQIETTKNNLKTNIKRDHIEKIIMENATIDINPKEKTDWENLYKTEFAKHENTKMKLKEALDIIEQLKEQISKLKKALLKKET